MVWMYVPVYMPLVYGTHKGWGAGSSGAGIIGAGEPSECWELHLGSQEVQ